MAAITSIEAQITATSRSVAAGQPSTFVTSSIPPSLGTPFSSYSPSSTPTSTTTTSSGTHTANGYIIYIAVLNPISLLGIIFVFFVLILTSLYVLAWLVKAIGYLIRWTWAAVTFVARQVDKWVFPLLCGRARYNRYAVARQQRQLQKQAILQQMQLSQVANAAPAPASAPAVAAVGATAAPVQTRVVPVLAPDDPATLQSILVVPDLPDDADPDKVLASAAAAAAQDLEDQQGRPPEEGTGTSDAASPEAAAGRSGLAYDFSRHKFSFD